MAFSPVQSAFNGTTSGTSIAKAYTSSNTVGNCLVAMLGVYNGGGINAAGQIATVADTAGNMWYRVMTVRGGTPLIMGHIFVCQNCVAGANTITGTVGQTCQLSLHIIEFSGVSLTGAVDQATQLFSASSGTSFTASIAPGTTPSLLLAYVVSQAGSSTITIPGMTRILLDTSDVDSASFYAVTNATSSYTLTVNQTGSNFMGIVLVTLRQPPTQISAMQQIQLVG